MTQRRTASALRVARLPCVLALALAPCACQEERVEYQYRPSYMAGPDAPSEILLPDGTKVIFVDKPMGETALERTRPRADARSGAPGTDGKAAPARQFEPRSVEEDGRVVLRNFTTDHVVANTMQCLRNEEYQLIWDQLLAPETRKAYEEQGGYEQFVQWCRTNRRPTMELLNRMQFDSLGSAVVVDKLGNNRLRARLSPHLWDQFKLRVIEFRYTEDGMKLVTIRAE